MAKDSDHLTGSFETENTGGVLSGFLAEEDEFDRRALWRIGSWGVAAVGAVILAVMANQTSMGWKREQLAAADLSQRTQQIQGVARASQNETRRLAAAIDTLNSDRDRLYNRVTTLEQGLDSVTGTIARQRPAASPAAAGAQSEPQPVAQNPVPAVAPVATTQTGAAIPEKPAAKVTSAEPGPATVSAIAKDSGKADPTKSDMAKAEAAKLEATQAETTKTEAAKAETAKIEIARTEVARTDLAKAEKPPAATPATPLVAAKSMMAPPDPSATKLVEPDKPASAITASPIPEAVASAPPISEPVSDEEADEATTPKVAIQRTEFGVDLGTANSVGGLRALWRGLLKSKSSTPLTALRPIIVVKERNNGPGMQLRLVAGPLNDAGAAAKICAVLTENKRACETTIFDGQRLSMNLDEPPAAAKPQARRRAPSRHAATAVVEEPKKPEASSSWFGRKGQ